MFYVDILLVISLLLIIIFLYEDELFILVLLNEKYELFLLNVFNYYVNLVLFINDFVLKIDFLEIFVD